MTTHSDLTRAQVLRYRVHVQQLDRTPGHDDATVLDLGVQDTGPDGARWALTIRGADPQRLELFWAWTLRGAPHAYRRTQAAAVAVAVGPWTEQDAAKRIFDAAKPLRANGIAVLDALDVIAGEMRSAVSRPTVKGDLSEHLNRVLPEAPYQRHCVPCGATHVYEMPFRLAALRGGLELEPDTSPPVLRRIPGWRTSTRSVDPSLDPIRAVLHLLGPATVQQVSAYLDCPVRTVKERWPEDAVPVTVDGEKAFALAADLPALSDPPPAAGTVRLLGPFDLFLQGRDRERLVPDATARKDLWRALGRPGGILAGAEVVGSWRPRAKGAKLKVAVNDWSGSVPDLTEEAERLAAFRGLAFDGFSDE